MFCVLRLILLSFLCDVPLLPAYLSGEKGGEGEWEKGVEGRDKRVLVQHRVCRKGIRHRAWTYSLGYRAHERK